MVLSPSLTYLFPLSALDVTGGRIHSPRFYSSGEFSGMFKCPSGNSSGLLTSFYLSSREGYQVNGKAAQDEIDFEWVGNEKRYVQTNYYVNGEGGKEIWIDLHFDCSEKFHRYAIRYSPTEIIWLIDGIVRRSVSSKKTTSPYPTKPMFLYASVWDASGVANGSWTGEWSGQGAPYVAQYQKIRISPLWELRNP